MSHPEESKEQLSLQQHSATKPSTSSTLSSSSSSSVPSSSPLLLPPSDVQLRPSYSAMFKPRQVESMMRSYVEEYLREKQYDANESSNWAKDMAAHIKNKLKELRLPRYKYLVQVTIGENKGAGVRCGARCFWDQTTDKLAQTQYVNDTMFCVVAAFGVYLY